MKVAAGAVHLRGARLFIVSLVSENQTRKGDNLWEIGVDRTGVSIDISIDPNVRPTVFPNLDTWRTRIDNFAELAQLLKVSTEDLQFLYPGVVAETIAERYLAAGVKLVVITDGDQAVSAWTQHCQVVRVKPLPTKVVDTVGAGDTFQAALLVKLFEMGAGISKAAIEALDEDQIHDLLSFANQAARLTCLKRGADSPYRSELSKA